MNFDITRSEINKLDRIFREFNRNPVMDEYTVDEQMHLLHPYSYLAMALTMDLDDKTEILIKSLQAAFNERYEEDKND